MTTAEKKQYPKPNLARRLAAMLYDSILLVALLILIGGAWITVTQNGSPLAIWGTRVIFLFLPVSFFIYFWRKSGQTLGMTTWRLHLRSLDNSEITVTKLFIRLSAACLSFACLGLGYLWMLIDKEKLTWHDHLSKTALELLPKKIKANNK